MTALIAIIGVGNDWRADDGAGREVARRLRHLAHDAFRVVELDGEPARIVEAWDGVRHAILVDAGWTGALAGTVTRTTGDDLDRLADSTGPGSHAMGVAAAIGLGRAIGRLPEHLEVITIEGEDFTQGEGLSAPVKAAVDGVVAGLEEAFGSHVPL